MREPVASPQPFHPHTEPHPDFYTGVQEKGEGDAYTGAQEKGGGDAISPLGIIFCSHKTQEDIKNPIL